MNGMFTPHQKRTLKIVFDKLATRLDGIEQRIAALEAGDGTKAQATRRRAVLRDVSAFRSTSAALSTALTADEEAEAEELAGLR